MDLSWLPSIAFFVIGVLILGFTFKNSVQKTKSTSQLDWKKNLEREHELQFIRTKTLPEDLFLKIDFKDYPVVSDSKCQEVYLKFLAYAKLPIVYLGKKSNIEIKEQFGVKGLEMLIDYERNYFNFMDISYQYGNILYDQGFIAEAKKVLELSMVYGCASSKSFLLLGQIYRLNNEAQALKQLRDTAIKNMENSPLLEKVLSQLS